MGSALLVALAWAAYGALHSLLAAETVKRAITRRWPVAAPSYRLAYNLIALVTLAPPLIMVRALGGPELWRWSEPVAWVPGAAAILVLAGFAWSSRYYDMREMLGLAPSEGDTADRQERFVLSPMHRHVRHPWYFLLLVLVWTRDTDAAWLATAIAITGYLIAGSSLEERRLVRIFGDRYERYRERVPGLVPLPGRSLSVADATELARRGRDSTTAGPEHRG